MYLNSFINYWQTLVSQHKFIKQFYRLNHNEIDDALRSDIEYPILVLNEYDGEIKASEKAINFLDYQKCSILFLDQIDKGDYDQEHQKLNDLKRWAFGIFAKIKEDIDKQDCPRELLGLQPNSIQYYITDFQTEHVKGWLFEFTLKESAAEFIVNPNDWN